MKDEFNQKKMLTLRELRQAKNLSGGEMAERLEMPLDEYYRAENGKPPKWMKRAVKLFEVVFEDGSGILPTQLKFTEKPTTYRIDADN